MSGQLPSRQALEALAGPSRPLSLHESARVLGGMRWVELEAFVALGRIAGREETAPGLAIWSSSSSLAHGRRAAELGDLLPVSLGVPGREESTTQPDRSVSDWAASLSGLATMGPDGAAGVESWYRVLAEAYDHRASHPHPSADGALVRTLGRLAANVRLTAGEYRSFSARAGGEA